MKNEQEEQRMTNEVAIKHLTEYLDHVDARTAFYRAMILAISALEQEPCDAVSREMALKECYDIVVEGERYRVIQEETLLGLPPITQKSGKWIENRCDMYICSQCQHTYTDLSGERLNMNFCPNCGAKMVEPQESESDV